MLFLLKFLCIPVFYNECSCDTHCFKMINIKKCLSMFWVGCPTKLSLSKSRACPASDIFLKEMNSADRLALVCVLLSCLTVSMIWNLRQSPSYLGSLIIYWLAEMKERINCLPHYPSGQCLIVITGCSGLWRCSLLQYGSHVLYLLLVLRCLLY